MNLFIIAGLALLGIGIWQETSKGSKKTVVPVTKETVAPGAAVASMPIVTKKDDDLEPKS